VIKKNGRIDIRRARSLLQKEHACRHKKEGESQNRPKQAWSVVRKKPTEKGSKKFLRHRSWRGKREEIRHWERTVGGSSSQKDTDGCRRASASPGRSWRKAKSDKKGRGLLGRVIVPAGWAEKKGDPSYSTREFEVDGEDGKKADNRGKSAGDWGARDEVSSRGKKRSSRTGMKKEI